MPVHQGCRRRCEPPGLASGNRDEVQPPGQARRSHRTARRGSEADEEVLPIGRPRHGAVQRRKRGQLRQRLVVSAGQRAGERDDARNRLRAMAQKGDAAAVGRPAGVHVAPGIRGQWGSTSVADQLDVDVRVAALPAIPAECHLLAVRREGRSVFLPGVRGQRHEAGGRNRPLPACHHVPRSSRHYQQRRAGRGEPAPASRSRRSRARGPRLRRAVSGQFLQRHCDVGHALVALRRVLAQASSQHRLYARRHVVRKRRRLFLDDGGKRGDGGVALEGTLAAEHFVEHRPEREDVRALVDRLSLRLLGGHVVQSSDDAARFRPKRGHRGCRGRAGLGHQPLELRQAEVHHLHASLVADHDVRRFHVTMHDPDGVSRGEAVGHLQRDLQRLMQSHPRRGNQLVERLARHVLHRDEVDAGIRRDVVDGDDVRVVQGRGGPGFLRESLPAYRVVQLFGREDLHGDEPIEMEVLRLVDNPHAAFAELLEDSVVSEDVANHRSPQVRSHLASPHSARSDPRPSGVTRAKCGLQGVTPTRGTIRRCPA